MSLRSFGGDVPPPEHLKSRVLGDLRARGLLQPRGTPWLPVAAVVGGLGLFVAGFLLGRGNGQRIAAGPPALPQYALFLYEDAGFDQTQPEGALVAEYGAWAGRLAAAGQLVGAEKLGAAVSVEPATVGGVQSMGELTGYFIIAAPSDSVARDLARASPHLRHGGRIVVRRIDPT